MQTKEVLAERKELLIWKKCPQETYVQCIWCVVPIFPKDLQNNKRHKRDVQFVQGMKYLGRHFIFINNEARKVKWPELS